MAMNHAEKPEPSVVYIAPEPVQVALSNTERIRYFFDVAPKTLRQWHELHGFPLSFPDGRGPGKTAYVPIRQARDWIKAKSML
jgi:hypothetical protein